MKQISKISEFTKKVFKQWSKKLGRPMTELTKMYDGAYEVLARMGKPEELLDEMARSRVKAQLRSEFASPAIPFKGKILAASPGFNVNARKWEDAATMFKSPERDQWIANDVINEKGEPLDTLEFYSTGKKNPRFGKPLPRENFLANAFGVLATADTEPLAAKVTLSRDKAKILVPINEPVTVRLNNRTKKGDTFLTLSSGSPTAFRKIEDPDIPDAETLITMYCEEFFTVLKNLEKVHLSTLNPKKQNKPDPTRITIVEAELVNISPPTRDDGNYRMVIQDQDMGFTDEEKRGTTAWVPQWLYPAVEDAGPGTRMFIIGQTTQPQTRIDFATGETLNEPGDVGLNALGIHIKKGWLMPKIQAEEEIAEEVA